ncbi:MAG: hypothetical protein AAF667_09640 [Pseudomonadota bacterium]
MLRSLACAAALILSTAPLLAQTLQSQVSAGYRAAQPYASLGAAKRAGWRPFGGEAPLMGRHFSNKANPDYVHGEAIDFSKPNNLVYATVQGQTQLVALAYIVRISDSEPLPPGFAGAQDIWHVHDGRKFLAAVRESYLVLGSIGERWFNREVAEDDGRTRLSMVHLWLIPNPKGPFATHNPALVYRDLGLPLGWADTDMDVARGLALTTPRGCNDALEAELWIAGVSRAKKRSLMASCNAIAANIRASLNAPEVALEQSARQGWQRLEGIRFMTLSEDERRRAKAFVEDGPGICR